MVKVKLCIPHNDALSDLNLKSVRPDLPNDSIVSVHNGLSNYIEECILSGMFDVRELETDRIFTAESLLEVEEIVEVRNDFDEGLYVEAKCKVFDSEQLEYNVGFVENVDELELNLEGAIASAISRWTTANKNDMNELAEDIKNSIMDFIDPDLGNE